MTTSCSAKLNEKSLPPHACFYNKLNDEHISEEDYAHQIIDLYLETDILLLAHVFENFREKCYNTYKLVVAWYYTMPGYSWSCCLRYTQSDDSSEGYILQVDLDNPTVYMNLIKIFHSVLSIIFP
nr:unnamed protein product [Callosobruchus chinensis]